MSDLDVIRELEEVIGWNIKRVSFEEFKKFLFGEKRGEYVFDEDTNNVLALRLERLSISYVPECICNLRSLKKLDLGINQLSSLPEKVCELKDLQVLRLSSNQLSSLPEKVCELENLQELNLNNNQLSSLPEKVCELKNLQGLNLSSNQLNSLPEIVCELKSLQRLYLSFNQLNSLPEKVCELNNLQILDLSFNQLRDLPEIVLKLNNLQELYLINNQLSSLPEKVCELKNLQVLFLSDNQLIELPETIATLDKLQTLNLEESPILLSPPPSVVSRGLDAIRAYFKNDMVKVHTCKMVVVGEGGVGKTCFLDALQDKTFNPQSNTTHGIDIRKLTLPLPTDEKIQIELNVWDFGGQDIYHATHQFYLTNHSLFVLVWSARQGYEAGKVYKWLETIKALAPDSPILIVATHSKDRGADLPKGDILAKYSGRVSFFEVDNETRQGLDELREAIRQVASKLKYTGIGRPKSWVDSKNALYELKEKYISEKQLFNIFKESGIDENSYAALAQYLYEMGDILYYPDEEELKDTVIVKPEWVSQHIAKILDSKQVSNEGGFLRKSLMREIWNDLPYDMQQKFIKLMEKFDLSYRILDSEDTKCLIVEKLKYEEHPEYKQTWDSFVGEREIVFKYVLDIIPAGIPTWFIVRTHRFSIPVHWRTGVVLMDVERKHMGLVIADSERKEVWLKVKGEQPYYFFTLLRDTLEFTFKRFEGLNFVPHIPCRGHNGQPCSHLFKLEHLEKKLKSNPPRYYMECPEEQEDIDVTEHIFGLSYADRHKELAEMMLGKVEQKIEQKLNEQNLLLTGQVEELKKFIQLEFFKSYQSQQKMLDQTCPNLFTLKPIEKHFMLKPLEADEFELQLYCQKPGDIHPVEGGKYVVRNAKKWVKVIAWYYNKIVPVLKIALPLIAPFATSYLDSVNMKDYDFIAKTAGETGKVMQRMSLDNNPINASEGFRYAEGSELRALYELLTELDPNKQWGGLERTITPEGHILWLCKKHKAEYKQ